MFHSGHFSMIARYCAKLLACNFPPCCFSGLLLVFKQHPLYSLIILGVRMARVRSLGHNTTNPNKKHLAKLSERLYSAKQWCPLLF